MVAKRLFLVLAIVALVLLQFTDCMAAMAPDQQSEVLRVYAMHAS
jgi:hypothetical protein